MKKVTSIFQKSCKKKSELNNVENKMTDEYVKKFPWLALENYSDKLTPEQFDYCMHKDPWAALKFCEDKLTEEQKRYCEEMIDD